MATEEVPVTKESLDEKLGDLKLEEPEKFEDTTESPPEEIPEEAKDAVLEELTENPPKLHHVETEDTTEPTEGGVVKSDVPEAFEEELKKDHDIVPPTEEAPTGASEAGAEDGTTAPATPKKPSIGEKISATLHKIVGKD